MKKIDITNIENLTIKEDAILIGKQENLNLVLPAFASVQIVLTDLNVKNLNLSLEENSSLKCDSYEFSDKDINLNIQLARNSSLKLKTIASLSLEEKLNVFLNGENASFDSSFLVFAKNSQSNITTNVFHKAKYTTSNVSNYGISLVNGGVTYTTTGKIERGFSGSSCVQLSRGIIAGDKAYVKALPILLIDEYDVKANHGASIGKMSDDELFYLMSRGLNKQEAFKLILSGIINPFLESLVDDNYREQISESIYRLI